MLFTAGKQTETIKHGIKVSTDFSRSFVIPVNNLRRLLTLKSLNSLGVQGRQGRIYTKDNLSTTEVRVEY